MPSKAESLRAEDLVNSSESQEGKNGAAYCLCSVTKAAMAFGPFTLVPSRGTVTWRWRGADAGSHVVPVLSEGCAISTQFGVNTLI